MSEIEKMYENAGIKSTKNWQSCLNCKLKTETRYDDWGEEYLTCKMLERPEKCSDAKEFYPPFTAEKQLELIKWLGELDMLEIMRTTREDKSWIINSEYGMSGNVYKHTSRMKSFEEALARLINSLWQDLSEEEKQQVKGILE